MTPELPGSSNEPIKETNKVDTLIQEVNGQPLNSSQDALAVLKKIENFKLDANKYSLLNDIKAGEGKNYSSLSYNGGIPTVRSEVTKYADLIAKTITRIKETGHEQLKTIVDNNVEQAIERIGTKNLAVF